MIIIIIHYNNDYAPTGTHSVLGLDDTMSDRLHSDVMISREKFMRRVQARGRYIRDNNISGICTIVRTKISL